MSDTRVPHESFSGMSGGAMQNGKIGAARAPISVYTASKLSLAPLWLNLISAWPEVHFTARWVKDHVSAAGEPKWPGDEAHGRVFWQHDWEDVARARVVLCYGRPDEVLRGALVEAGIALGMGKNVIVVGQNASYSTWQYHRNVFRVADLDAARSLLRLIAQD